MLIQYISSLTGSLNAQMQTRLEARTALIGTIQAKGALAAAIAGGAFMTGTLIGKAPVSTNIEGRAAATATIQAKGTLRSNLAGRGDAIGAMQAKGALTSYIAGRSDLIGLMTATGALSGHALGSSGATGSMQALSAISGHAAGHAIMRGFLVNENVGARPIFSQLEARSALVGLLTGIGAMQAGAQGGSTVVGNLTSFIQGAVQIAGTSELQGMLSATGAMSGEMTGITQAHGNLTEKFVGTIQMDGIAHGYTFMTGELINATFVPSRIIIRGGSWITNGERRKSKINTRIAKHSTIQTTNNGNI